MYPGRSRLGSSMMRSAPVPSIANNSSEQMNPGNQSRFNDQAQPNNTQYSPDPGPAIGPSMYKGNFGTGDPNTGMLGGMVNPLSQPAPGMAGMSMGGSMGGAMMGGLGPSQEPEMGYMDYKRHMNSNLPGQSTMIAKNAGMLSQGMPGAKTGLRNGMMNRPIAPTRTQAPGLQDAGQAAMGPGLMDAGPGLQDAGQMKLGNPGGRQGGLRDSSNDQIYDPMGNKVNFGPRKPSPLNRQPQL